MTITATQDYAEARFTWNDDLTECHHVAMGIDDATFDQLIAAKVHEGNDLEGWTVTIS